MGLARRQFLHLAAGAAALPAVSGIARAKTYPTRPVRLVVPYAAGGPSDIAARLIGQSLAERLGQQIIIENRPGAGSNIGSEVVARAPADGYTLLMASISSAVNATLYEKLNFNFIRDVTPVAGVMRIPMVVTINPAVPFETISEFMAIAKANPGKLSMASGGNGSASHITGELFKLMTGVNLQHVPYRGEAPALTDLLGGQVQVMFPTLATALEHIRARKLRALAATTAVRLEVLPDSQPSAISSQGTKQALGLASSLQEAPQPRSSTSSIRRSTRASPTQSSRRDLPTWALQCFRARQRSLAISLSRKPRSGARSSSSRASGRTDCDHQTLRARLRNFRAADFCIW